MRIVNNRRGTEIISIWELFVLLVVGGGIVIGVLLFYSADVDVREGELNLLYEKLALCLNENGYLNQNFLGDNFDIMKECDLNPKVISNAGDFYFEITLTETTETETDIKKIEIGNIGHLKDCQVISESEVEAKNFAVCLSRKELVKYEMNNEQKEGIIVIKTGSNQRGGKIPVV